MRGLRAILMLLMAALLSACALTESDRKTVAMLKPQDVHVPDDVRLPVGKWPASNWWSQYNDAQLDTLIQAALAGNPTIQAAQARIAMADSQVRLARAASGPQIGLIGLIDRQSVSSNGFLGPYAMDIPELGISGPWYTSGLVGLTAGMNLDVWGRDRAVIESAVGAGNARQAELEMVRLDVSTRVAQLYFELQKTRGVIEIVMRLRDIQANMLLAHQTRHAAGLESETAAQLASAQKLMADAALNIEQARAKFVREALRALVGPGGDAAQQQLKTMPLPAAGPAMPANLDFELLARRPDLQALSWYILASLSQIDAAQAEFFPSFDIKAFFGLYTIHISDLFSTPASRQINLIPGLRLPIFDSGLLNANLDARYAGSNLVVALYNQAVLDAVRDVAQIGSTLQGLQGRIGIEQERLGNLTFAADGAQGAAARGLISQTEAQESQLPALIQQAILLDLQGQQLFGELGLIRALGGGAEPQCDAATQGCLQARAQQKDPTRL